MASAVLPSLATPSLKKGKLKKTNILMNMECFEEELSSAQLAAYYLREKEYRECMMKIENARKNAMVLEKTDSAMILDLGSTLGNAVRKTVVTPVSRPLPPLQPTGRAATSPASSNAYQLVMSPRVGLVVNTVPQLSPVGSSTSTPSSKPAPNKVSVITKTPQTPRSASILLRSTTPTTNVSVSKPVVNRYIVNRPIAPNTSNSSATRAGTVQVNHTKNKPAPTSTSKTPHEPDSREVQFSKLIGKTYPSLVVVARPQIKQKELTPQVILQESTSLDAKVKSVLMYTPTKFTEWLIQQGLVRSEQFCTSHVNPDMTPVKLKLGMYSDVTKFPYSGGYVWISDCCPQRFVSVFSSSIFEASPHPPTTLLKLMYHWSCQTVVQNILSWVKVDSLFVKNFFTNLRAVCTAAVHEKLQKLGGPKKRVEIGVISLGTTTSDGVTRQVKVEVLGVLEQDTKSLRLIAVEPLPDHEKNVRKRFAKILETLEFIVDKDSVILTDFTVDKSTLLAMGFKDIIQSPSNEPNQTKLSNAYIMTYLRRVVPRTFQSTLSLLSRPIMQQFLDELVWREKWGYLPNKAFANIIIHISEQTRIDSGDNILSRLQNISVNPFKNWKYAMWKINCSSDDANFEPPKSVATVLESFDPKTGKRVIRKRTAVEAQLPTPAVKTPPQPQMPSSSSSEMVYLESYYYGTIPGDSDLLEQERKGSLSMKCCACSLSFATNIQLMNHLIGHAMSEDTYVSDLPQCRYCLKYFNSQIMLQSHLDEIHGKSGNTLMCKICEEKFRERTSMILHMHRNHYHLELPYECGVCGFRTSQHTQVVDHFYQVHSNGEKVQCPFCLKIVAFGNNGRKITQNLYFFLNHIQKHKRKTLARKCSKCALWFVHKGVLKEHQQKDHLSFKNYTDIQPYVSKALDAIKMPKPMSDSPILIKSQLQKTKDSLYDNNSSVNKFNKIEISGALEGSKCCECEGEFLADNHFDGFYSCMRCPYSTCCSKAMMEHSATCHEQASRQRADVGIEVVLEEELHCVCGFKSSNGNRLAKHLVNCGRKSAYPTADKAAQSTLQAQSASFPPLVNLDDHEAEGDANDKWLQAFVSRKESAAAAADPQRRDDSRPRSMLDVLGLVRKPSTEESPAEKSASN